MCQKRLKDHNKLGNIHVCKYIHMYTGLEILSQLCCDVDLYNFVGLLAHQK